MSQISTDEGKVREIIKTVAKEQEAAQAEFVRNVLAKETERSEFWQQATVSSSLPLLFQQEARKQRNLVWSVAVVAGLVGLFGLGTQMLGANTAASGAKEAAREAKQIAKDARDATAAEASQRTEAARLGNEAVGKAKEAVETANEAKLEADRAKQLASTRTSDLTAEFNQLSQRYKAELQKLIEKVGSAKPEDLVKANELLTNLRAIVRVNDPKNGVLQIDDLVICWGQAVPKPNLSKIDKQMYREFRVAKFKLPLMPDGSVVKFDGTPVVTTNVNGQQKPGYSTFVVYQTDLPGSPNNKTEDEIWVGIREVDNGAGLEAIGGAARAKEFIVPTGEGIPSVSYIVIGKIKK